MQFLRPEQYYVDRYDLQTIKQCLQHYWSIRDRFIKEKDSQFAKYTQEKFEQEINKCLNLMLYAIKGQRYMRKQETIQEWMNADERVQKIYDETTPPQNIICQECSSSMKVTHKDLRDSYKSIPRILFIFECTKCKKRQSLFEDGKEWKYVPPKCPKCKYSLDTDIKIEGNLTTFISKCSKCNFQDEDVSDHGKWKKEQEVKEKKDKELLEKYRNEFCFSDEEGLGYIETTEAMEVAAVVREEEKQKYDNSAYERSLQLKKTSVSELENLLSIKLEESKYIKLFFDKPEIGQHIIVPFTVQDEDSSRNDKTSSSELEKIVKSTIEDTNWRLLSNSVTYRLGFLKGQLKGYELEEDLLKLAGKKKEPLTNKKIDEVKRQKYNSNNLVQLARLFGKHDGIEAIRKRRLEKEPDGFILNDGNIGYTCGICSESISGDNTWWDLKGIRCLDCQRNLKDGVIPLEIFEDDYGHDVFVKRWQLKSNYGIYSASIKKLQSDGKLKGRDLKREDGTVYETLYVVSENEDFFDKHTKQKSGIKINIMDAKGNKIEL